MKRFLKLFLSSLIIAAIFFVSTIAYVFHDSEELFWDSYQRALPIKYNYMMSVDEPKVVLVGGSSSAFGFDTETFDSNCNYRLCNLGLMANLGPSYMCEIAKANLNPGDIVLLSTEYEFLLDYKNFTSVNSKILMTGIGKNWELYKYLTPRQFLILIGDLIPVIEYKYTYQRESSVYSVHSFNEINGDMSYDYSAGWYDTTTNSPHLDITDYTISSETIEYLRQYKKDVEALGAKVYYLPPAISRESIVGDYSTFSDLTVEAIEDSTGIDCIGDPTDFFYEDEDMYDGYYHLDSKTANRHTLQVVHELKEMNIVK